MLVKESIALKSEGRKRRWMERLLVDAILLEPLPEDKGKKIRIREGKKSSKLLYPRARHWRTWFGRQDVKWMTKRGRILLELSEIS